MKLATKSILVLTLALGALVGAFMGLPAALLALAGGALCLVISLVWASLESLGGSAELTLEEALALAAPTVAEEQKRAVLRTLKDLEYELSVGKISQADFDVASAHFRAEAKRLIAQADSSLGARLEQAEARARRYLDGDGEKDGDDDGEKKSRKNKRKSDSEGSSDGEKDSDSEAQPK